MTAYEIKQRSLDMDINFHAAIKMRLRYLHTLLERIHDYIEGNCDILPEHTLDEALDEMFSLSRIIKDSKTMRNDINDAMIEQARAFPIEMLIPFVNGKAKAWCHDDNEPSLMLYKKHNKCTCFPCGRTYNSIDVLMERDGYSFIKAVKYLCGL